MRASVALPSRRTRVYYGSVVATFAGRLLRKEKGQSEKTPALDFDFRPRIADLRQDFADLRRLRQLRTPKTPQVAKPSNAIELGSGTTVIWPPRVGGLVNGTGVAMLRADSDNVVML